MDAKQVANRGVPRRGRPRLIRDRSSEPTTRSPGNPVVQTVVIGCLAYVQRYVRCSAAGCSVCGRGGANYEEMRPGHGPYWYAEWISGGVRRRRYVGRRLREVRVEGGRVLPTVAGAPVSQREPGGVVDNEA